MNNQSKNEKQNKGKENIDYNILGNVFIGNLLDMSGDGDNSGQNLAMYLESESIKQSKN